MKKIHSITKLICILVLLFGAEGWLPAQTEQPASVPESPEVLFPTMVLEADAREDLFFFPLPLFAEPRLELPSPLQEVEPSLTFPPDFLSVSILPPEPTGTVRERTSLYTEGTLGVGTMASLAGSLSLFQRGEASKFNLKFSHQSRDGYQFRKLGNGYFDRQDQMVGEGGWKLSPRTELELEGNIEEREIGLQGASPSYSNLYRFVDGKGTVTHHFSDDFRFSTEMGIHYASRLLTGFMPEDRSETLAKTFLRLEYGGEKGFIALQGSLYGGAYSALSKEGFWVGEGTLEGEWNPMSLLSIGAGIGFLWVDRLEAPFHVEFRVKPQEELLFTLQGKYTVGTTSYGNLWKEVGPVAQSDTPIHPKTFSVGFRGEAKGMENRASFALQGEWQRRYSALLLLPYDVNNELFPLQEASLSTYKVQVEGSYIFFPGILGSFRWIGLLGDRALLEKQHTVEGTLRIAPEKRSFGGTLSGTWATGPGSDLPILTIGGYYRPRENVEVSLTLEDILSPYGKEDRVSVEPFITPGFRVLLKTTVTF